MVYAVGSGPAVLTDMKVRILFWVLQPRGGMVYTPDLKSAAFGHPGSNPGGATVDSI